MRLQDELVSERQRTEKQGVAHEHSLVVKAADARKQKAAELSQKVRSSCLTNGVTKNDAMLTAANIREF